MKGARDMAREAGPRGIFMGILRDCGRGARGLSSRAVWMRTASGSKKCGFNMGSATFEQGALVFTYMYYAKAAPRS